MYMNLITKVVYNVINKLQFVEPKKFFIVNFLQKILQCWDQFSSASTLYKNKKRRKLNKKINNT